MKQVIQVTFTDLENNIEYIRKYPYAGHSEEYTLGEQLTQILQDIDENVGEYSVPKFEIITI